MKKSPQSHFGCQCGYAETHYKFKLPWAPLWKPWPEIFVDAPSFAIPGVSVPFWLVVKDAHEFPIMIEKITWTKFHKESNTRDTGEFPLDQNISEYLKFIPLKIQISQEPGDYFLDFKIEVRNLSGSKRDIINTNYTGIPKQSIQVRRLKHALPYPSNWVAGDLHCHTDISSDQVEFGGDLQAMTEAAKCVGLDFWSPTDHSYDFNYKSDNYMEECSPQEQWDNLQDRINQLDSDLPTVIRGEEVSAGNSKNKNVHFLILGEDRYFPGLGDGGRRWFNNKPDMSIPEVLSEVKAGVCFAAHPRVRLNPAEALLLNRGSWSQEDIYPGITGLQFWNGNRNLAFREGRAFWVKQLLRGQQILPIAGNDAHGDLNRSVGVKWPLFSLWASQNHVFGQVRTLFPGKASHQADVLKALHSTECCITDGPFIQIVKTTTQAHSTKIQIHYSTNEDWGKANRINVFYGNFGDTREQSKQQTQLDFKGSIEVEASSDYIRAELYTDKDRLAMTSALFLTEPKVPLKPRLI